MKLAFKKIKIAVPSKFACFILNMAAKKHAGKPALEKSDVKEIVAGLKKTKKLYGKFVLLSVTTPDGEKFEITL